MSKQKTKRLPKKTRKGAMKKTVDYLHRLDPRVRRWLNTPDPDEDYEDYDDKSDEYFDKWLLKAMARDQIMDVGGVLVDKALLTARTACVPELCSPAMDRGHYKSCCADLTVFLDGAEKRRLSRHRVALAEYLEKREPRLKDILKKKNGRVTRFFLDEDGDAFCRPGNRCVFSKIDSRGRIRCHLHTMYKKLGVDRTDLQPITCRIFPLILCHMPRGKVLVTIINRENYKAWGSKHPRYFPCLNEPDLPPALKSMGPTLDWLFGKGFVKAIERAGAERAGATD